MHSHTYSGIPLGCSAGIGVLNILKDEKIIETSNKNAIYFNNKINEKFKNLKNVGEIRHIGLVNAIELVKDKNTKEEFEL